MPSPTSEAKELGRSTRIENFVCIPSRPNLGKDQPLDVKVRFDIRGGLYEVFNRETWQHAYEKHDTLLRLMFRIGVYRKSTGFISTAVIKPIKFVRKGKLYWTRNPDLTDNVTNRIWAFMVTEDGAPKIFDSERDLRDTLFGIERLFTISQDHLKPGRNVFFAKAWLKWGRHTYIEKGSTSGSSRPFEVTVE
jgi:hypothetical protein